MPPSVKVILKRSAGKFRFDPVSALLTRLHFVVLPKLNLGKEFLFPIVRNCHQCHIPYYLLGDGWILSKRLIELR